MDVDLGSPPQSALRRHNLRREFVKVALMKRLYVDPVSEVDQFMATIVKYIESCARAGRV